MLRNTIAVTPLIFSAIIMAAPAGTPHVVEAYGRAPLAFEPNRGQAPVAYGYVAHTPSYTVLVSSTESQFLITDGQTRQASAVRMRLDNSPHSSPGLPGEKLPGVVNYLKGQNPEDWRFDIPTYERVVYRAIYSGIDIVYYGNNRQVEYDLVIAPGADPSQISISIEGADRCKVDESGTLQILTPAGVLNMHRPVAYQTIDGSRHTVAVSYRLRGNRVTFQLAHYDRARPLIIDPTIIYSTLLGGNGATSATAIAVDSAGNAYVGGYTNATNFPTTPGVFRTTFAGGSTDGFVTKLDPTGTIVLFSTYIGGNADDYVNGIAVDSTGNIYTTGYTYSGNFPTVIPSGPLDTSIATIPDAFVLKLTADGKGGPGWYSVVLGSSSGGTPVFASGSDIGYAIAVDSSGRAYVTGQTASPNFCTTNNSTCQTSFGGGDVFVARVTAGVGVDRVLLLGGASADAGLAVTVDSAGTNIYVAGYSSSTFGASPVNTYSGGKDAFVAKLNSAFALVGYTFFGGPGNDEARAIALSGSNIYIAGQTSSTSLPQTSGMAQPAFGGGLSDGYLARFNSSLGLAYSTYLGGSGTDAVNGIAVDSAGNIILAGNTDSTNFPVISPLPSGRGGLIDAFVTKLNSTATTYVYSTYLGGVTDDFAQAVATSGSDVFVVGHTFSADFPVTAAPPVARPAAFVTRIQDSSTTPTAVTSDFDGNGVPDLVWQNEINRSLTIHYYAGTGGVVFQNWNWLNTGGAPGWHVVAIADFDRNGTPDLIWQNDATRQVTVHYYGGAGGAVFQGWNWLNQNSVMGWRVVAAADFNGDGTPDIVWQNDTTRQVTVHYYGGAGGAVFQGWNWLNQNSVIGWRVVAAADFNGDRVPDLIWQNDTTRQVTAHYYGGAGGAVFQGWNWLNGSGVPGWHIPFVADFNRDGVPDIVWQNDATHQVTVHYYGGAGGALFQSWNWLNASQNLGWFLVNGANLP